ncbi:MAG TPA: glycoside hydrolase family 31 protein, partial [Balneolaceae bacterium]|nr:glycoside hydrolase family 31 protein [Balneolaceae bacterium]
MADTTSKQGDITEGAKRKADVKQRRQPDNISNHRVGKCSVVFRSANDIELRVRIHSPEIIQLQYTLDSDLKSDFSYAIDPNFEPASPSFEVNEKDRHFDISTASVICRVSKKKMKIQFLDNEGNVLDQDAKGYERYDSLMKGTTKIRITKKAPDHTAYFGLGDKASNQNLRGQSCQNWNTDCYAYERDDDPLYRSIPFYAALYENRAYGIFVDNSYRSHFDFDSKGKNISSFAVDGGIMNYYFIYGPDLTTVTERYTKLTGTPELPPLWALGYHQCRWSYFPESRVMEIARSFRDKEIPCDAIYLDIDYLDEFRSFTWDSDRFPDPKKMIKKLKNQGFKTVVMIDPGIKVDPQYFVYKQGLENDFFCKRADGDLMTGPVWPSQCAFPDFTNPDVRDWWANLYEDLMSNKKVAGIWNDMNEPAMFEVKHKTLPDDVRHDYDGHRCSHKKAHNIYGMQMVRASQKGIKKYNEGNRPFLLTRANFSGGQRYAALWTGDNISNWDHLKLANQQCQRLSISGYSFVGTDIGGFVKQPSAQLFTRWLQLSVFHPLFRNHTMGYNTDGASAVDEEYVEQKKKKTTANQEPWTFGKKYTDINRSVIELRYRLLHYLYTAFWKYTREGTPILRPLRYFDQADKTIANHDDQFLFGEKILVSPVVKKNKQSVKTYFPKGRWYDYRTNECYEGQSTHEIDAPIADIPFFIKEGTVLPLREVMQHSRERDPDFMELNIYYGEQESESLLYEDAEEGYEYQKGAYRLTTFRMKPSPDKKKIIIKKSQQGDWSPAYAKIKINVIGLPFECSSVSLDGKDVAFNTEKNDL